MKDKQIQIPQQTFLDLYILCDRLQRYNEIDEERLQRATAVLEQKIEAVARRSLFTQYKIAAQDSQEREALRKQYLEQVSIHPDWQTPTEKPYP